MATVEWYSRPQGETVLLRLRAGYCAGEKPPKLSSVRIRRAGEVPGTTKVKVVVSAFVDPPARAVSEPGDVCSDIATSFRKRVRVGLPASEAAIYDGSDAPPRRVPLLK